MTTKPTRATVKSFISKNRENLMIRKLSHFDGMTDGVESTGIKSFSPAVFRSGHEDHTYGIAGVWMVLRGGDYISAFEENGMKGFHVYNCCGSFDVAVRIAA
jgi:hypothetical protein